MRMASDTQSRWDAMLAEFRSLGGIADNICIKDGQFGRGLFSSDPSKPVDVYIPESLLIDVHHLHFSYSDLTVGPESPAGAREKAFIENYEREFSWGVYRRSIEDLMREFRAASPELRAFMESPLDLGAWLAEINPKSVAERFFSSRCISYGKRAVVMPIIELANHGTGTTYKVGNGIRLSGQFDGEIFARYELISDSLQMFESWGFAPPEDAAFSLRLAVDNAGIVILREQVKPVLVQGVPFVPDVSTSNGQLTLSHLLLGHKKYPRLAKGIFYRIMRNAGRSQAEAESLFDTILHTNRTQFYKLLALSEDAPPQFGRLLRSLARFQLEAMSNAIGARDV
jgi:hypothetical protein